MENKTGNMVETIDRQIIRGIAADMTRAVQAVAEKYGIEIKYKGASFSTKDAGVRFEVNVKRKNGETKEAEDFKRLAAIYGLKQEWLGQNVVLSNRKLAKIVGLLPKRRKNPILVEVVGTGKQYIIGPAMVVRQLENDPKAREQLLSRIGEAFDER